MKKPSCNPSGITPRPNDDAEALEMAQVRVGMKDPEALKWFGDQYMARQLGLEEDASRAFELWLRI